MIITKELIPGVPRIIVSRTTPLSVSGTTALTTIISETIPGGLLGANGYLMFEGLMYSSTADCRTGFVKMNGLTISQPGNSGQTAIRFMNVLKNQNSVAVNVHAPAGAFSGSTGFGSSTSSLTNRTIDTNADIALLVQLQPSATTHTVSFEYFYLWACYKP